MTHTRANLSKCTYPHPPRAPRGRRSATSAPASSANSAQVRPGPLGGIWYEAVTDNSDYAYLQLNTANSRIKPCHRYCPIPDTEVTYSKNNLDNNEYKAFGL